MRTVKIIGVIPSRFSAQRFPGKPLALIHGIPMINRVVQQCKKSKLLSEVWVATDDGRIQQAVKGMADRVVMTPKNLLSGTDRVAWAVQSTAAQLIINIQGDEPVIHPSVVDAAAKLLIDDSKLQMSTVVVPMQNSKDLSNPNVVKAAIAFTGSVLYFSRSPIPYFRDKSEGFNSLGYKHLGIYGYRKPWLLKMTKLKSTPLEQIEKLEQLRTLEHGVQIKASIQPWDSISVDQPSDIKKVEQFLKHQFKTNGRIN
jgi:3-deoxy-manno-octulosonate cytidylyltransferase (CMP-KDO synthetase)